MQLYGDRFEMSVANVHAMGLRAHANGRIDKAVVLPLPEQLQRFGLDFVVFAAAAIAGKTLSRMSRDATPGISRSRKRLHRHHAHRLHSELPVKCGERKYQSDRRAIGIGDDEIPFPRCAASGLSVHPDDPD